MGADARGVDRGNGGLVAVWWVVVVWHVEKKCEKLLKKRSSKIFPDGNFGGWPAS
jgi:hypothetical protein